MRIINKHLTGLVVVVATTVLMSGCALQAPGNVMIVTPTIIKAAANSVPSTPLAVAQVSSSTPLPPTPIPLVLPTNGSVPASDVTPMATYGPAVGPDYTPATPVPVTPGTLIPINATPSAVGTAGTPPAPTVTPTPGPSATPLPVLAKDFLGLQIHGYLNDADWQKMLDRSKTLGVTWIKVQVLWKQMAPTRGAVNDIFQTLVLDIQRAHTQGFKTLLTINSAPDWARGSGPQSQDGPPVDPQDLANFASNLVYVVKPEFVDAVEIWNEPNLRREWNTPGIALNGATYMKYFDAAYQAIRHTETLSTPTFGTHHITIIAAAPATGTPNNVDSVNDRDWLKQLYAAGLAHYASDISIGAHPYGWGNAPEADCCKPVPGITGWYDNRGFFFKDTLDDYRQIMVTNHHDATKIWVTEFGWGTYDGLHRSDGSPAGAPTDPGFGWINLLNKTQQADYTIRAFLMASKPPYASFVGPMMLWNLNFGTIPQMIDTGRQEAGFSLLDFDGSPRPVYSELANAPKQ